MNSKRIQNLWISNNDPPQTNVVWVKPGQGMFYYDDGKWVSIAGLVKQPADGLTPYIDDITKHWMIGEEDTNVDAEGKDAYQLYVASVPSGTTPMTKSEWLASLKGERGNDGYTPIRGQDYYTAQDVGQIESYVINELIDSITVTEQIWARTTAEAIQDMIQNDSWTEGVVYYTAEEDEDEANTE